jgi:hypothetical protein
VQPYSPERRTALVLCGTGAHGVYHAGALRALQEAGVKIDVMAGQGVGAGAAALAAIDGAARLWEPAGVWRGQGAGRFYRRKWTVRSTGARRSGKERWWLRILARSIDVDAARNAFAETIWQLIRGATHVARPAAPALGRRYSEVLLENLGQPGFRELLLVATDLDSRRDVVAGMLKEPYRRDFVAPRPDRERQSEMLDLAGTGRDHSFDMVAAALSPPVWSNPHMMTFAPDSYWRGETHRLCDRPGAVSRLLEELAAAGVSQAIIVSAVPAPSPPHRLTALRLELRHRLGEFLNAAESAALRDAIEIARLRFDSIYLIRPAHNPVGPFDMTGAYDEASDRRQSLFELMQGAYEDAYRQFIEPVVGGSGEHLAQIPNPKSQIPSAEPAITRFDSAL